MPIWYFIILAVFVVVALVAIRWRLRGAIVDKLPILSGEQILLEEENGKVFHAVRGDYRGRRLIYRVRVVVTDQRIIVATGGPEGKHKFFIRMIIDYRTPSPLVTNSGYSAYSEKFKLENGYPTYYVAPGDVSFIEKDNETGVRLTVPFPERGRWYINPEVIIYTNNLEVYKNIFKK